MIRILGVLGLLIALYVALFDSNPGASSTRSLSSLANIQGRYGVITLGAALVIITGGIDLSVGSVVGCSIILFGTLIQKNGIHPFAAVPLVLLFGVMVGLANGLLITRLKLQSFLVTLCGMFIFRGAARMIGKDISVDVVAASRPEFADALNTLTYFLVGKDEKGALLFPAMFAVLIVLAAVVGFFLHRTAYGRYWYAIGHNEQAAKYAGVNVDRQRTIVYIICSTLAALCGILLFLDINTHQADSAGAGLELYAILGAVLGGCSLRGGEGTVVGMVLGAMVLPVLQKLLDFRALPNEVIPGVIGLTLLFGTIVDELIRRRSRIHR